MATPVYCMVCGMEVLDNEPTCIPCEGGHTILLPEKERDFDGMYAACMNEEYDQEIYDDIMLERQEMEDFEQTDEYFGYYGDSYDE